MSKIKQLFVYLFSETFGNLLLLYVKYQVRSGLKDFSRDHFTVVCLVSWPLNESEAGVDLVLIETSLLLLCKFLLMSMRTASFYQNKVNSGLTFIQWPGN